MSAADRLRQAKALIHRHGWRQGYKRLVDKSLCLSDALAETFTLAAGPSAQKILCDVLKIPDSPWCIMRWNDERGRTVAEVDQGLDLAIYQADRA